MHRVFVLYSQPIRFARFGGKSVNRGLPVLDQARALDLCCRPEGSCSLGMRMHGCEVSVPELTSRGVGVISPALKIKWELFLSRP